MLLFTDEEIAMELVVYNYSYICIFSLVLECVPVFTYHFENSTVYLLNQWIYIKIVSGSVSRQNMRYWSDNNPRRLMGNLFTVKGLLYGGEYQLSVSLVLIVSRIKMDVP
jgi:hypothetical protein